MAELKLTLQKRLELCPLFRDISDLSFLTRCLQPLLQRLGNGQQLDWRGGGYLAVLAEGRVQANLEVTKPGAVLGLEAALTGSARPTVTALRPSVLLLLPVKQLFRICSSRCPEHRRLAENTARCLAVSNLALREREALLLVHGIRARLCAFLKAQHRRAGQDTFTLPYTREALSIYLNLSRPSLSRELCLLRDEGTLEFYRETIRLLRPEAL